MASEPENAARIDKLEKRFELLKDFVELMARKFDEAISLIASALQDSFNRE